MSDINETIRLAEAGARHFMISADQTANPDTAHVFKLYAKSIRALIARESETCEWAQTKDWDWTTACGRGVYDMCGDHPKSGTRGYKFCPYCGRKLVEKKQQEEKGEGT